MTREQKILSLLAQFDELGINKQIDYDKFCLYSIVANSAALDSSTLTDVEVQLLLDEGISADGRPMTEQLMVLDLKAAYEQAITYAKKRVDISVEMLNKLSSLVLRNAAIRDTQKTDKLEELCQSINQKRMAITQTDIIECYKLSFDTQLQLATINSWADGNGRMSRLLMNLMQFEFGIIPTEVIKDNKSKYNAVLVACRENGDRELFQNFMFNEHIRNLQQIIHNYQASIEDNGMAIAKILFESI